MRPQRSPNATDTTHEPRAEEKRETVRSATVLPFSPARAASDELQAYVDHQLEAADREAVEASLARRPLDRAKAAAYGTLNLQLRQLFQERVPPMSSALRELVYRAAEHFGPLEAKGSLARRC